MLGVNPLAGCLPLFAQMPILMGMFYALRDLQHTETQLLWLPTLSMPDPYYILPVLFCADYLHSAEADNDRNEPADEDHDDLHADFHWLDQFDFSSRSCSLLGDDEYHADPSAVVDVPW